MGGHGGVNVDLGHSPGQTACAEMLKCRNGVSGFPRLPAELGQPLLRAAYCNIRPRCKEEPFHGPHPFGVTKLAVLGISVALLYR